MIASVDGRTRSQGTLSTARQIFFADIDGVTVAASGVRPLSMLAESRLDEDALVLRLLEPVPPWPLSRRPVWTGISQLEMGHWLDVDAGGRHRRVRWWEAPPPDRPLRDAAGGLREALLEALAVRAKGHGPIGADLSGGMDSTGLCFLASAAGADLITYHRKPKDRSNDDTVWAQRAAKHLPLARHRIVEAPGTLAWWGDVEGGSTRRGDAEGPGTWYHIRSYMEHLAQADASEGARRHLIGLGGDELFISLPTYLWSLVRAHPLRGLRVANQRRAANRWGLLSTARGLLDRSSLGESLIRAADELTAPLEAASQAPLGWGDGLRMPPWATKEAVGAASRLLRAEAAKDPHPLCSDRVRHQMLEFAVHSGGTIRQLRLAFADLGVEWDAPYLDDRVIEAALSVRIEDRAARGRYKPLLRAAMTGVVPDEILERRTKGEYSADEDEGLRRNRRSLLGLCDDSRLAQLGMVNADRLRAALISLGSDSPQMPPLANTMACESWLRSPSSVAPMAAFPQGDPR
ncbi:asparagine synthase-related protein [Actinomadura rubrisoli]|nr:asparagine synthase-related protein [Actinomadura rubrisoli]